MDWLNFSSIAEKQIARWGRLSLGCINIPTRQSIYVAFCPNEAHLHFTGVGYIYFSFIYSHGRSIRKRNWLNQGITTKISTRKVCISSLYVIIISIIITNDEQDFCLKKDIAIKLFYTWDALLSPTKVCELHLKISISYFKWHIIPRLWICCHKNTNHKPQFFCFFFHRRPKNFWFLTPSRNLDYLRRTKAFDSRIEESGIHSCPTSRRFGNPKHKTPQAPRAAF